MICAAFILSGLYSAPNLGSRFFEFLVVFLLIFLELQVLEDRNLVQMYRHPSTSYIWNKMKVKLCFYFSLYCVHTFRSIVQKCLEQDFHICYS